MFEDFLPRVVVDGYFSNRFFYVMRYVQKFHIMCTSVTNFLISSIKAHSLTQRNTSTATLFVVPYIHFPPEHVRVIPPVSFWNMIGSNFVGALQVIANVEPLSYF